MNFYTKEQKIPYNAPAFTAISNTGLPVTVTTFDDEYGFIAEGREVAPYSENDYEFFIRTDKQEEATGLWIWENVTCDTKEPHEGGYIYALGNGDFVFESEKGKYGYFLQESDIADYLSNS